MTTTDSNGIIRWESTDPVTPLEATLNAGMDSVSAAVTGVKNGIFYTVANVTERATRASEFSPTASKPLYVHRIDAPGRNKMEYTINGTDWFVVGAPTAARISTVFANLASATNTFVPIPALSLSVPVVSGRWYDMETSIRTTANVATAVLEFGFYNGTTQIFTGLRNPNSSGGVNFATDQPLAYTWQATATGTLNLNVQFRKASSATATVGTNNNALPAFLAVTEVVGLS